MRSGILNGRDRLVTWVQGHRFFAAWVSLFAVIVLLAALSYRSNNDRINDIQRERTQRAALIAESDFTLCAKIYGQFVSLERESLKQVTVENYHRLLPSLPIEEIRNLVATNRDAIHKVIRRFDIDQCKNLPSQHLNDGHMPKPSPQSSQ